MDLIPVLDVRGGIAVRADGGERARYAPLESRLVPGSAPADLARAYREELGLEDLYLAELDAIAGGGPEAATPLVVRLADAGARVWVDAGASAPADCNVLLAAGAARVVIGLETLPELAALEGLAKAVGARSLVFSLDLRDGRPVSRAPDVAARSPADLARAARRAGFSTVIALELGRVGSGRGPARGLLAAERRRLPGVRWVAGGGVRGLEDVLDLARDGWHGCLVGTALHMGAIGRSEIDRLRGETAEARLGAAAEAVGQVVAEAAQRRQLRRSASVAQIPSSGHFTNEPTAHAFSGPSTATS